MQEQHSVPMKGDVRVRLEEDETVTLVCYDGHQWIAASNNTDPLLQQQMRRMIQGRQPGLYPPLWPIGVQGDFPLQAA